MNIDVKLGMPVVAADGTRVGKVDGLVVDPDRNEFLELIVHKGFLLTTDRIVDKSAIDDVADGQVYLRIDADAVERLPQFSAKEYAVAMPVDAAPMPFAMGGGPTTNQAIYWKAGSGRREMHGASMNTYQVAVAESAVVEVRSNLPESSVVIDRGTDVITADDRKLGVIEDIVYNERGEISGFVVKGGFIQHHDVVIPIADVVAITHRYIRLNTTYAQAEGVAVEAESVSLV
jgi:uncharacterized protein YrrD